MSLDDNKSNNDLTATLATGNTSQTQSAGTGGMFTAPKRDLSAEINGAMAWAIATPILGTWFLLSFLPFFSLFSGEATAMSIVLDVLFLGTGFVSVVALYFGARFAVNNGPARETVINNARGKGLYLAAYALGWITLYGLYRLVV